jgi:hypothetical protein
MLLEESMYTGKSAKIALLFRPVFETMLFEKRAW